MKISVDLIVVVDAHRIRQDIGDLTSLKESIDKVGLINPILVDEKNTLIAGFRRLAACKELGWSEIEVQVIDVQGDSLQLLDMELAENIQRKEFTAEEIIAAEEKRKAILEAQRPQKFWKRFWLWLKGLFSSGGQDKNSPSAGKQSKEPQRKNKKTSDFQDKGVSQTESSDPTQKLPDN